MHELSRAEHDLPRLEVLAGEAAVLSRFRHGACGDADTAVVFARPLLHDHGVGTFRHHAAGEDAHALSRADGGVARLARERFADAQQRGLAAGREIGEADRIAVHRRIVVTGHRQRRHDVARQDAAER